MRTDRRGFLGLLAGALGVLGLPGRARSSSCPGALEIHRITRNTRTGAIWEWLTSWGDGAPPDKAYAGLARVSLPAVAAESSRSLAATVRSFAPAAGFEAREIPLATLARLLHLTNGITGELGGVRLRAAPSAGARYAGEVYVAAERIQGLAPGLYHFAVLERALVRLRAGAVLGEIAGCLEEPDRVRGAAFAVLHTNVFDRYGERYGNRGYRYALIDTGHIAENLRLAAASEGFGELGFTRFEDERLDALLAADGRAEAVCFVSAVGVPAEVARSGARGARFVEVDARAALAPGGSVLRYHEATRLVRGKEERERPVDTGCVDPGESAAPDPRADTPVDLPSRAEDPSVSVEEAIRKRRSPLVFVPEAIDAADLAFVLTMARGEPPLERAAGVELFAIVHRVRGVAPGLYASDGRRIALRRAGDLRDALTEACLWQDKAGLAVAALFMVARPADAAARSGARAYRDLLVECGAIAQRIYLAAESIGLAARNLAAFWDDELNDLLGFGPDGRAVLHLTLLGRDASDGATGRPPDARPTRRAGRRPSSRALPSGALDVDREDDLKGSRTARAPAHR